MCVLGGGGGGGGGANEMWLMMTRLASGEEARRWTMILRVIVRKLALFSGTERGRERLKGVVYLCRRAQESDTGGEMRKSGRVGLTSLVRPPGVITLASRA